MTRRGLQLCLGVLWLLDGALQLQPVMFTGRFASGIIAPAAVGQPALVHWAVSTTASVIGSSPALFDAAFATAQLLLGIGLLWRRSAPVALLCSVGWAAGVWVTGEGAGGLLGSGATALTGAPGAAALYALLALAAWPGRDGRQSAATPARWIVPAWVALWAGLALLELRLGAAAGPDTAASLTANLHGLPSAIVSGSRSLAAAVRHAGAAPGVVLAAAFALVALLAVRRDAARAGAGVLGALLAGLLWVFAEGFGAIPSGQATDPNSGPLLALAAVAVWSIARRDRVVARAYAGATGGATDGELATRAA